MPSPIISGLILVGVLVQIYSLFGLFTFLMLLVIKMIKKGIKILNNGLVLLICVTYLTLYINSADSTSEMHKIINIYNNFAQFILDIPVMIAKALRT